MSAVVLQGSQGAQEGEHVWLGVSPAADQEAETDSLLVDHFPEVVIDGWPEPKRNSRVGLRTEQS